MKSPFDAYIQQILANPQYLLEADAHNLMSAIKKQFPKFGKSDLKSVATDSPKDVLRETVASLQETISRMNTSIYSDDGGLDSAGLKRVVDSQEKLIRILTRLQDQLSANQRQEALESALTESLEELENKPLQEAFLKSFHAKLAEKSEKIRNSQ